MSSMRLSKADVVAKTRAWISNMVIRLNLCPFARKPFESDSIRYAVSEATTAAELGKDFKAETKLLLSTKSAELSTTLLICPYVENFDEFYNFNAYIRTTAKPILEELDERERLQLAYFHPKFCYQNTKVGSVVNYTSRAPFPTIHFLRQIEVSRARRAYPEGFLESIPYTNTQRLKLLGLEKVREFNNVSHITADSETKSE